MSLMLILILIEKHFEYNRFWCTIFMPSEVMQISYKILRNSYLECRWSVACTLFNTVLVFSVKNGDRSFINGFIKIGANLLPSQYANLY